jgi:hypothetical protein
VGLAKETICRAMAYKDDNEDEDEGTSPSSDRIQSSNKIEAQTATIPPAAGFALDISKMANESYKHIKQNL